MSVKVRQTGRQTGSLRLHRMLWLLSAAQVDMDNEKCIWHMLPGTHQHEHTLSLHAEGLMLGFKPSDLKSKDAGVNELKDAGYPALCAIRVTSRRCFGPPNGPDSIDV